MKSGRAKVLHEVAGLPLLAWSVEAALSAGADRVVAIIGHQREDVSAMLARRYGDRVETVIQEQQRGTGHAVLSALPALADEPDERVIVVTSGDAPGFRGNYIADLAAAADDARGHMALIAARAADPTGYGRLIREDHRLTAIVEETDLAPPQRGIDEINAGFYGFRLGLLRREVEGLEANNAQGELYLTDVVARAAAAGDVAVIEAPFSQIRGINDRVELADVEREIRREIAERWMRAGVTMVSPEQTFIDADVDSIGRDVWLGPGVCLRGRTTIGEGARIDAGAVLTDVSVAAGAWIKPYSVLTEAEIGPDAQVGPFSHCRPGTRLDERAKVGNFVETKKTRLRAGAKANHHAYLGDASIGAGANIGAGTITCNYDGFEKHPTTIEDGAFIGTNTELVAPVTVGRDAYVGAGTTVTMDVPRASLALSRVKQVNVEGWADRFRESQAKRKNR
jgi:bifunctional UDP-N-acetylglucosamine pyrophosphorylase/glucosamine-1-phosphate N-acetyltransferase